jgi:hypothetical protein
VTSEVAAFDKLVRSSGLPAVGGGEAKKSRRSAAPRKGRKRTRELSAAAMGR